MRDAVQELVEIARRMGLPTPLAEQFDREVRQHYGGDQLYIRTNPPKNHDAIRAAFWQYRHDRQVYARLAREFGLTERRIRQIVDG